MKAIFLLATLKSTGLSNTETLCEFLSQRMAKQQIQTETIKLVEHSILPGTHTEVDGADDEWPELLAKILAADIVIFATPIWWDSHSSLAQRVIERLDEIHDEIMEGNPSPFEGKVGGIVITGDSDGAEHLIGNFCNFFNAIGLLIPPYATLSVLWSRQSKGSNRSKSELLDYFAEQYGETAEKMIGQMVRFSALLEGS